MKPRVLVVDDEPLIRESLARALASEGMAVDRAGTAAQALEIYTKAPHELVILDLKLPDGDGLATLRRLRAISDAGQVVIITAHGTIETAVEAMKMGAYDFVKKPFDLDELLAAAKNALRAQRLERRLAYHDGRARKQHDEQTVRGVSVAMTAVWRELDVIGAQPVPVVLITGESGTGKSLIARALHYRSDRSAGPFVELNAAAIPDTLVESELFGHERGAFSDAREAKAGLVEVADGGTLFLDEVGDLAAAPQAKLLSFLESLSFRRLGSTEVRTVDARIITATNQPLERLVEEKRLRADLYYRLASMTVAVPPLRARREDIPLLASHFVAVSAQRFRKKTRGISEEASRVLAAWPWPGNVRELKATIQRVVLMNDGDVVEVEQLPRELIARAVDPVASVAGAEERALPTLEEMELRYIRSVYHLCGGNKVRAAERLGITRQTLARKLGEAE